MIEPLNLRNIPITFIVPLGAKNKPTRYTATVDAKDYPSISKYQWFWLRGRHTVYAIRNACEHGIKYRIYMHRQLLGFPREKLPLVDHKNGNGTDNRRDNLRVATPSENQQNRHYRREYSSKYRGVVWDRHFQCWRARVTLNQKMVVNKTFKDELQAAKCAEEGRAKFFSHYQRIE